MKNINKLFKMFYKVFWLWSSFSLLFQYSINMMLKIFKHIRVQHNRIIKFSPYYIPI